MSDFVRPAKQERARETQQRILEACKELMEENSFDSISLRTILEKANTSIGSFYARFPDKDALLPALYAEHDAQVQRDVQQLKKKISSADSIEAIARLLADHFVKQIGKTPNLNRALFEYVMRDRDSHDLGVLGQRRIEQYAFVNEALLQFRDEIAHENAERAIELGLYFLVVTCRNRLMYPFAPHTQMLKISKRELRTELANLLSGYLRCGAEA